MSQAPERERTPAERVHDIPAIMAAIHEAVREAVLDHARAGNPIVVWRDGQCVWIQPEDIPAELARAEAAYAAHELDVMRELGVARD
jgi:hypothetical protein